MWVEQIWTEDQELSLEYVCQVDILNRQLASSLYFQGRFVARAVNVGVISI